MTVVERCLDVKEHKENLRLKGAQIVGARAIEGGGIEVMVE